MNIKKFYTKYKKLSNWEKLVFISAIILFIILIFKLLFWISVIIVAVGIIWIVINLFKRKHNLTLIPIIMIIVGLILSFVSYQVGYGFEKSEIGKSIVNNAKIIVQTDDILDNIEEDITGQIINNTIQIVK